MCDKCEFDYPEIMGEDVNFDKVVASPSSEIRDINIFDSPEDEQFVIWIEGCFMEYTIGINYCPFCGRELR